MYTHSINVITHVDSMDIVPRSLGLEVQDVTFVDVEPNGSHVSDVDRSLPLAQRWVEQKLQVTCKAQPCRYCSVTSRGIAIAQVLKGKMQTNVSLKLSRKRASLLGQDSGLKVLWVQRGGGLCAGAHKLSHHDNVIW